MSMITLSRSNHNRYAVFYMIAGIVLSLSILAALLMPHPAYAQSEQVQAVSYTHLDVYKRQRMN